VSKLVVVSGDATITIQTGMFGGSPKISVECETLSIPNMTPQQFADWIYPFIKQSAELANI
jgi:hypothetical protein